MTESAGGQPLRPANLDYLAAQTAQSMLDRVLQEDAEGASTADTIVTNALGVLLENGLYGCILYLLSRRDGHQPVAEVVASDLLQLLARPELKSLGAAFHDNPNLDQAGRNRARLDFFASEHFADSIRLFLIMDLFERTFVYARYGAKGQKKTPAEQGEGEASE